MCVRGVCMMILTLTGSDATGVNIQIKQTIRLWLQRLSRQFNAFVCIWIHLCVCVWVILVKTGSPTLQFYKENKSPAIFKMHLVLVGLHL